MTWCYMTDMITHEWTRNPPGWHARTFGCDDVQRMCPTHMLAVCGGCRWIRQLVLDGMADLVVAWGNPASASARSQRWRPCMAELQQDKERQAWRGVVSEPISRPTFQDYPLRHHHLAKQMADGRWLGQHVHGVMVITALAFCALEMPKQC